MNKKSFTKEFILTSISDKSINILSTKKIFFGHMSVGYNILDGMEQIIQNEDRFNEIEIRELSINDDPENPGIYHARIGKNGFPKTKCDAFLKSLTDDKLRKKFDIAFFKFCYVDIERDYDIQKLFNYYVKTIKQLKEEFPHLVILHVTIPLTAHKWGLKGFIKNLILGDVENVKRNQFNELLKNEYRNVDPIFDLAEIESTYPDGSRSSFKYQGKVYFSLAKEYTTDGGHLNETGKYYTAESLLIVLSEIALRMTNFDEGESNGLHE